MVRKIIQLTDGSGKRFNINKAKKYESDYIIDGEKRICKATGSQWIYETLYKTSKGFWVKHWQWHYTKEYWYLISEEEAMDWLNKNAPSALEK